MSGELVARLRDQATAYECFDGMRNDAAPLREAADRIEELEGNDAEGKFAAALISLHRAEKRIEKLVQERDEIGKRAASDQRHVHNLKRERKRHGDEHGANMAVVVAQRDEARARIERMEAVVDTLRWYLEQYDKGNTPEMNELYAALRALDRVPA